MKSKGLFEMGDQILYRFGAFAGAGEQGQRRALLGNTSYMVPRHVCIGACRT